MQVQKALTAKGFKVMHINTCSIKNKVNELNVFLHQTLIDICTCSETWLHDGIEDVCLTIPNYSLYRQDRYWSNVRKQTKRGGGLLTYVSSDYSVDHLKYRYLNANNSNIEAQVLFVKKYCNKGTIIINTYRPP